MQKKLNRKGYLQPTGIVNDTHNNQTENRTKYDVEDLFKKSYIYLST